MVSMLAIAHLLSWVRSWTKLWIKTLIISKLTMYCKLAFFKQVCKITFPVWLLEIDCHKTQWWLRLLVSTLYFFCNHSPQNTLHFPILNSSHFHNIAILDCFISFNWTRMANCTANMERRQSYLVKQLGMNHLARLTNFAESDWLAQQNKTNSQQHNPYCHSFFTINMLGK